MGQNLSVVNVPPGSTVGSILNDMYEAIRNSARSNVIGARGHLQGSMSRPAVFITVSTSSDIDDRDTLKRHVAIHGPNAVRSYEAAALKGLKRAVRACERCVKSKQRCDSRQPCQRCHQKDWKCQYPSHDGKDRDHDPNPQLDNDYPTRVQLPDVSSLGEENQESSSALDPMTSGLFDPFPFLSMSDPGAAFYDVMPSFNLNTPCPGFTMDASYNNIDINPTEPSHGINQTSIPNDRVETLPGTGIDSAYLVPFKNPPSPRRPNMDLETDPLHQPSYPTSAQHQVLIASHSQLSDRDDAEIILSENFRHVDSVSHDTYQAMLTFYDENCELLTEAPGTVPPREVVSAFVQLYFEHAHPAVPIIHIPTFNPPPEKWCLMAAVALIGCQHSGVSNRLQSEAFFHSILRKFITKIPVHRLIRHEEVYVAQSVLLYNIYLLFHGTKETLYELQYQRNIIITLCRPFLVGHGSAFNHSSPPDLSTEENEWSSWVETESWRRTIYFAWLGECFQWTFHGLPPILSFWELGLRLPCDEDIWKIADPDHWRRDHQTRREQPSLPELVQSPDIAATTKSLNDIGRVIAMTSLYTIETILSPRGLQFHHNPNAVSDFLNSQFKNTHQPSHPPSSSLTDSYQYTINHLLSILRFIPLGTLYASYGWRATKQASHHAENQLQAKMHNRKTARRLLLHAARLFARIRDQHVRSPYDPFCILIASLFICAYLRHVPLSPPCLPSPCEKSDILLRIDQPLDMEMQDA
ncbi:hypothetical protein FE257_006897 [Aspergillus nanangensis]|uniref:Zn(2)-C6 fungal-type domain-containing protein n=1 Tax=Aspergillus nanangensis TaxID=2582783 RepID=A0AAD4CNX9_ASPNN|nr:hypothetical protein FE257_006897 [Aspergillus nanangensis]